MWSADGVPFTIVDYVVGGWEEPAPVATLDLFVMSKELPGRSVASLASVIGQANRNVLASIRSWQM